MEYICNAFLKYFFLNGCVYSAEVPYPFSFLTASTRQFTSFFIAPVGVSLNIDSASTMLVSLKKIIQNAKRTFLIAFHLASTGFDIQILTALTAKAFTIQLAKGPDR